MKYPHPPLPQVQGILYATGASLLDGDTSIVVPKIDYYQEAAEWVYRLALVPIDSKEYTYPILWIRSKNGKFPMSLQLNLVEPRPGRVSDIDALGAAMNQLIQLHPFRHQAISVKHMAARAIEAREGIAVSILGGPHRADDGRLMFEVSFTSATALIPSTELDRILGESKNIQDSLLPNGDVLFSVEVFDKITFKASSGSIAKMNEVLESTGYRMHNKFIFDHNKGVAISISTGYVFTREFCDDALERSDGLDQRVQYHHDIFCEFAETLDLPKGYMIKKEFAQKYRKFSRALRSVFMTYAPSLYNS
jgi:hypothetical protein